MSNIETRLQLIRQIEEERGSRVLTYITGDRPGVAPAQIGEDAVRHVVEHLRLFGSPDKLDIFLYSRGGGQDVPWQLVSAFREASKEWSVIIPFRSHSAATLIALGADHIIMGPQAQLGPIDPSLTQLTPDGDINLVSVEDVMAFIDFIREKVGLSDQMALTNGLANLINRVDAVTLGTVHRTHSHIRDVARKIIQSRSKPPINSIQDRIISTLAEEVYAHAHAISRTEAKELDLPVIEPDPKLENLMWKLLVEYESNMKLLELWDPPTILGDKEQVKEECVLAVIESTVTTHEYITIMEVAQQRQIPTNLVVNLSLDLQIHEIGNSTEELLAQLQPQLQEAASIAVQEALVNQIPSTGIGVRSRHIGWRQWKENTS